MRKILLFFTLITWFISIPSYGVALNIQVSIKPLHSIVAFICRGVLVPNLLIKSASSPHFHNLSLLDIKNLREADLLIWIGPNYENQWQQAIEKKVDPNKLLTVIQTKGLNLYPNRQPHSCGSASCSNTPGDDNPLPVETSRKTPKELSRETDGHIWLDLNNVKKIATAVTAKISSIDHKNKQHYFNNLNVFLARIDALSLNLTKRFKVLSCKNYLTYHDSLQYFDNYFGFHLVTSLSKGAEVLPSAGDYLKLTEELSKIPAPQRPRCVFIETKNPDSYSKKMADDFKLNCQMIDYIGYDVEPGVEAFFVMFDKLAADIITGLS